MLAVLDVNIELPLSEGSQQGNSPNIEPESGSIYRKSQIFMEFETQAISQLLKQQFKGTLKAADARCFVACRKPLAIILARTDSLRCPIVRDALRFLP